MEWGTFVNKAKDSQFTHALEFYVRRASLYFVPIMLVSTTVFAQDKPDPPDSEQPNVPDEHDLSQILVESPPQQMPSPPIKPNPPPVPSTETGQLWPGPTLTGPSMWGPALTHRTTRWYGWQTLIPVVSAKLLFVGAFMKSDEDAIRAALFVSPTVHLFAGPIVHWAHGHFKKGALAFAMNLTFPLTMMAFQTLNLMSFRAKRQEEVTYGLVGASFIAAEVLDMVLLSSETVYTTRKPPSGRTWLPSSIGLLPRFDSTQRGVVLVGQF